MGVQAAIVVGCQQQAHPIGPAVRIVQKGEPGEMNRGAGGEVDMRFGGSGNKTLPLYIIADAVQYGTQLLLAALLDLGDNDETVGWHGAPRICLPHSVRR